MIDQACSMSLSWAHRPHPRYYLLRHGVLFSSNPWRRILYLPNIVPTLMSRLCTQNFTIAMTPQSNIHLFPFVYLLKPADLRATSHDLWQQSLTDFPSHHPSFYAGDFNSHNSNQRYVTEPTIQTARLLFTGADSSNLTLLFDAKDRPLGQIARRDYNPDLLQLLESY